MQTIPRAFSNRPETADTIRQAFSSHLQVAEAAAATLPARIASVVGLLHACLLAHGKILACGNGGSAADAQHLVAELVGRFREERRALAALTLMADSPTLTALGNDYGYSEVFARQVTALARHGDVLIAISTSGNSANVVRAAETARAHGCHVVALTGASGGRLAGLADHMLQAPSEVVARIQEIHGLCIHAICDALDALILEECP